MGVRLQPGWRETPKNLGTCYKRTKQYMTIDFSSFYCFMRQWDVYLCPECTLFGSNGFLYCWPNCHFKNIYIFNYNENLILSYRWSFKVVQVYYRIPQPYTTRNSKYHQREIQIRLPSWLQMQAYSIYMWSSLLLTNPLWRYGTVWAEFEFCNWRGCGIWTYIVIGEVIQWQLLYPYISLSMLPIYISPNTIPSWPRFDWVIILLQNIGEHRI